LQAVAAVVMALYMVSNPRPLVNGVLALFPVGKRGRVQEILQLIRVRVSGWIIGQIAAMALVFVLTWIGLAALGVEYAFTFAVLTGILEIVPFFGPILAAVPPTLAAFADSPTLALVVVIVYVAIHQIEAHAISPMVMARSEGRRVARAGGRRPGRARGWAGGARGAENSLSFLSSAEDVFRVRVKCLYYHCAHECNSYRDPAARLPVGR
jgi:hypothetical protein